MASPTCWYLCDLSLKRNLKNDGTYPHIYAYQRIWAQCWGILLQLSGMTTDLARNLEHNEDIREKARRLEVVSKLPFKRDSNCRDVG